MWRAAALTLGLVAALGCGDEWYSCTLEIRTAVEVHVTSPDGLPIDKVTARRAGVSDCMSFGDASTFWCLEQGGGSYEVRVHSGSRTWTDSVSIAADECHTTEGKELDFVLDPDTAD